MATKSKSRRVTLPLKRKIQLNQSVEAGGKTKKDIASELNQLNKQASEFGICGGTILHIMKNKEKLKKSFYCGNIGP